MFGKAVQISDDIWKKIDTDGNGQVSALLSYHPDLLRRVQRNDDRAPGLQRRVAGRLSTGRDAAKALKPFGLVLIG